MKKKLRKLIMEAKVDEALTQMLEYANKKGKTDLYDELSILQSQRSKAKKEEIRGVIDAAQQSTNFARLTSTLIDLLQEFEDEDEVKEAEAKLKAEQAAKQKAEAEAKLKAEQAAKQNEEKQESGTKILFLASNPSDSAYLQLDKEFKSIFQALQSENNCRVFHEDAVTPTKLQDAIITREPTIIHFSGHGMGEKTTGSEQGKRGGIVDVDIETARSGLVLQNEVTGKSQLVSTKALDFMFKTVTKHFKIEVVVLNACYSENQAQAILSYVPYVIGMTDAIADETAIELAKSFYKYLLVNDKSIEEAFELAQSQLMLNDMAGAEIPQLISRKP
jgi:hypothetical protein